MVNQLETEYMNTQEEHNYGIDKEVNFLEKDEIEDQTNPEYEDCM